MFYSINDKRFAEYWRWKLSVWDLWFPRSVQVQFSRAQGCCPRRELQSLPHQVPVRGRDGETQESQARGPANSPSSDGYESSRTETCLSSVQICQLQNGFVAGARHQYPYKNLNIYYTSNPSNTNIEIEREIFRTDKVFKVDTISLPGNKTTATTVQFCPEKSHHDNLQPCLPGSLLQQPRWGQPRLTGCCCNKSNDQLQFYIDKRLDILVLSWMQ